MSAEISFQQKDFLSEIRQGFSQLRQEKVLCDITLMTEDDIFFKAHKVVLSSFSKFFKKLFTIQDYQHPLIYLSNIDSSQLSSIMDYIYNGEVKIEQKCLDTFLSNSKTLKVQGLYEEGEGHHSPGIDVSIKKEYIEGHENNEFNMGIKKEKDVVDRIDESDKETERLLQDDVSADTDNISEDESPGDYGTIKYECFHCRTVFNTKEEILGHRQDCQQTSDYLLNQPAHKTYGIKPIPFVIDERREKYIMKSELFYYLGARNFPKNFIKNRFHKCSKKVPTVVEAKELIERGILSSKDNHIVFYLEKEVEEVLQGFKHKRYDMGTEFHVYDFMMTELTDASITSEDGATSIEERYFQETVGDRFYNQHSFKSYHNPSRYKQYKNPTSNWR